MAQVETWVPNSFGSKVLTLPLVRLDSLKAQNKFWVPNRDNKFKKKEIVYD
jgi:hypothetical protein